MSLSVFSQNNLQAGKTILEVLEKQGITTFSKAFKEIEKFMVVPVDNNGKVVAKVKCPECVGYMIPIDSPADNMSVLVCPRCRYSEVIK